jgi:hypothetical protein
MPASISSSAMRVLTASLPGAYSSGAKKTPETFFAIHWPHDS